MNAAPYFDRLTAIYRRQLNRRYWQGMDFYLELACLVRPRGVMIFIRLLPPNFFHGLFFNWHRLRRAELGESALPAPPRLAAGRQFLNGRIRC